MTRTTIKDHIESSNWNEQNNFTLLDPTWLCYLVCIIAGSGTTPTAF
jgi:hypothetical protein